jgi:hypothetical protein
MRTALLALLLASLAACAADADAVDVGVDDSAATVSDGAAPSVIPHWPYWRRYHLVAVPDLRRCAWPTCGGWIVRPVNTDTIRCWGEFGGFYADQCYVPDLDWVDSGLGIDAQDKVLANLAAYHDWREVSVVLRGAVGPSDLAGHGRLYVDAAWLGAPIDPAFPAHRTEYFHVVDIQTPAPVVRRLGPSANEDLAIYHGLPSPPIDDLVFTGLRDESYFDVDATFARVR